MLWDANDMMQIKNEEEHKEPAGDAKADNNLNEWEAMEATLG